MERVTDEQAAEIYARFLAARFGSEAKKITKDKLAALDAAGDAKGATMWKNVARHLPRI